MNEVRVSVILPARNAARTLDEALATILDQEGFGMDLEVLVVDDASEDRTLSIAQTWGHADPRVRIVALPRGGLVAALNGGLARAHGRYIARMDADDICLPDRLRRQVAHLERSPRLDVVGTGVRMFPSERVSDNMRGYLEWQNRLLTHRALVRNLLVESPLTHATALFRRDALEQVGGWRDLNGPEDLDLWLRGAAAGWRFGKVNRVLYGWRERPDRQTRIDPRMGRARFRALALDACASWVTPESPVLLWGWGDSLRDWSNGLRARKRTHEATEVNPRAVRGAAELPDLPDPELVVAPRADAPVPVDGRRAWVLVFGSAPSRETVGALLRERGYREGVHYCFAS